MKKKLLFLIISICCGIFIFSLTWAGGGEKEVPKAKKGIPDSVLNRTLSEAKEKQSSESELEIPDWLKRTSYGITIESDQVPRIYLETVQPLYQSMDKINTLFTHGRLSMLNGRGTYSLGFGFRRLMFKDELLAGINTFFDYQDLHQHYRQGIGLELIGKLLEFRANSYIRLSPKRTIEEIGGKLIQEQVADGFDTEIGGPIPYLPWLKIFGSYYRYDFRKFSDMLGWKVRGEIKPFDFLTFNLETYDDNKGEQEYSMDTRFNLAVHDFTLKSILSAFKLSKEPYPALDLTKRTLDRVERNFKIIVEKWALVGGVVEIRRGN